ncbi:winged helix DNA-binding domain-containing protein [Chloroflexota bacterium]
MQCFWSSASGRSPTFLKSDHTENTEHTPARESRSAPPPTVAGQAKIDYEIIRTVEVMINLEQMNYLVLSKHHLTEMSRIDDIVRIAQDTLGLHATIPTTPYLSLYARSTTFKRSSLDIELYLRRTFGRIRCVRRTIYILPKDLICPAFAATEKMVTIDSDRHRQYVGVSENEYEGLSRHILEMVRGTGMTARQLRVELATTLNISAVLNLMCDQGLLVRGEPEYGWRSNLHKYYAFREYFPTLDLKQFSEEAARALVVDRYVASFGPVTRDDVAWWTGFPKRQVGRMVEQMGGRVTEVEISGLGPGYYAALSDKIPLSSLTQHHEQVVNLLPALDPYLMGYKNRDRYLGEEHRDMVFDRSGNVTSTILVDGKVVGV